MLREKLFKKLLTKNRINILENAINILLLTHNDLDGSGPVIILNKYFELIETIHCSNENMDQIISDNVLNEDILNSYDAVFITDIHCSKDTANKINELDKNNQDKIFLLDHHKTAMWLNEYPFAVVETNNPEDSFSQTGIKRMDQYNYKHTGTLGNASATTLLYDFMLSVVSILNKKKHLPYDLESIKDDFLTEFCFYIGIYDTWDWVNIFNKTYDDSLNRLFYIYGMDYFDNMYTSRAYSYEDIISEQDKTLLYIEDKKIKKYIEGKDIKVIDVNIKDKSYTICYCFAEQHLSELFEYMEEKYPSVYLDKNNNSGIIDFHIVITDQGISFRSRGNECIDVSEIAKLYGEGGHPQAAGCAINKEAQLSYVKAILNFN